MNNIGNVQIYIYHNEFNNMDKYIREIEYGIEEEGIPYNSSVSETLGYKALSMEAALASKLNVGIGIDRDGNACIKHRNFKEDQILFKVNIFDNDVNLRDIGINSARLIKGIPFNIRSKEVD